ncbi:MAG: hypothetical protein N5P05_001306 [Chroococcopsis gigantea SAG 12.99]|jgi:HlyD family secretion protein|nr:ABC exporter membrane fusion protein [Chlorogloea purpurea SAG 13.99]MDV2999700.1 hypothetical protein [Chroococcopsis gigantea SAG 12.99]
MAFKTFKTNNNLIYGLIIGGVLLMGTTVYYTISQFGKTQPKPVASPVQTTVNKITALGRIQPRSEVISLYAPLNLSNDRIAQLLVDEGDKVQKGQVIAVLDSRDRLADALKQAQEEVRIAEAKLAQVRAGAKTGEIDAQQATVRKIQAQLQGDRASQGATISRLEAQLEGDRAAQRATINKLNAEYLNAQSEFDRYEKLYKDGAISASNYDAKRLSLDTSRQQLEEARVTLDRIERTGEQQLKEARTNLQRIESTGSQQISEASSTLSQIAEVRTVDVQAAQAEINSAKVAVQKAQTELAQAYIKAPIGGQIITVHSRPGEKISDQGIVNIAQTQQMEVIAEIYQNDIAKIKKGQKATITGDSFAGKVEGEVRLIGLEVNQQKVFSNQPGENLDRKIIEVKIALDPENSQKVAGLTNSQVTVSIVP